MMSSSPWGTTLAQTNQTKYKKGRWVMGKKLCIHSLISWLPGGLGHWQNASCGSLCCYSLSEPSSRKKDRTCKRMASCGSVSAYFLQIWYPSQVQTGPEFPMLWSWKHEAVLSMQCLHQPRAFCWSACRYLIVRVMNPLHELFWVWHWLSRLRSHACILDRPKRQ